MSVWGAAGRGEVLSRRAFFSSLCYICPGRVTGHSDPLPSRAPSAGSGQRGSGAQLCWSSVIGEHRDPENSSSS